MWFVLRKTKKTYIFRAEIFVNSQKETIFAPQLQKRWNNDFILKTKKIIAKIAQLVEHDLAKVGVAGSSPVFRSWNLKQKAKRKSFAFFLSTTELPFAQMVKLVDTLVSGTSGRKAVQVRVLFWAQ